MTTEHDLAAADPARQLEPSPEIREHSRRRLDALLAAEPAPRPSRRRPRALIATAAAAFSAAAAVVAVSLTSGGASPAQAFAARLHGDGIVHIVLAPERIHEASGDSTNPRHDEVWMSLADGTWRVRTRLYGFIYETAFDGRTVTYYSSRSGETTTDTPKDPAQLAGHPFPGNMSPGVLPLKDVESGGLRVAGETTIDGETVYDLVPTRALPEGFEMHWYVSKDGRLRRMVQADADTIDESSGTRGPTSLTTDVESYETLTPTEANLELLRVPSVR